jgi:signal transduction histidine kinase
MPATVNQEANRYKILYVDDELLSLKYFQQIVSEDFDVITAPSAEEGMRVLEEHHASVGVVVSDQKLHGMQGTKFLSALREKYPDIMRILATAYADIGTAVSAINEGAIYHYISKPWEPESLVLTLQRAMERFVLTAERERLLKEKADMVRQLITSDRLAGYGVLAEGINHHLRNALVPVEIYLQIAGQEDGGDEEHDAEFLNQLHSAARTQVRRITEMLDRLASVTRAKDTSDEQLVSVENVWNEVQGQLAGAIQEKGVRIKVSVEAGLPAVRCSHTRLSYVMRLLVEDELAHLSPGSEVYVSLKQESGEPDGGGLQVRLELSDSGPNIPPERLPLMFTPFFVRQETPQYLGMNLAICYVTLDSLGGSAKAYQDPDRGTVVSFCFPVQPAERRPGAGGSKQLLDTWGEAMESAQRA